MANLKEIRGRITSIGSTMQITSAMKMVSAAKLKRATDAIVQMRPYSEKLQEILQNASATLEGIESPYAEERKTQNVLIVAVTSNRGLCGAFNNNIIKRARALAKTDYKGVNVSVLSVGKKAAEGFKGTRLNIKGSLLPKHPEKIWDDLTFENSSDLAQNLMDRFEERHLDKIVIVYNRFKNAAVQDVITEQFLPMKPVKVEEVKSTQTDYIFEPSEEEIVQNIIPKALRIQFYKTLLDSQASEHGARMTAMHKATDNAKDLKRDLSLTYNKARQAAITNEILEIVGGAEALNG